MWYIIVWLSRLSCWPVQVALVLWICGIFCKVVGGVAGYLFSLLGLLAQQDPDRLVFGDAIAVSGVVLEVLVFFLTSVVYSKLGLFRLIWLRYYCYN